MLRKLLPVALQFAAALAGAVAVQAQVPRFGTAEVVVRSTAIYDGGQGSPNPFTDVQLTASITAPGGRTFTVDGFFDGDGAGAQVGDVWKIRIFADEAGLWSWRTTSDAAGLDDRSGVFQCAGTLAGAFGQGSIVVDPGRPSFFRYRDGPPVYLLDKFLDRAAPAPIQFSQVFFSERLTEGDHRARLDRHLGMKLNKMNVYLANVADYGNVPTTPWLGSAGASDPARFDLARWHLWERWILEMRAAGMAIQLWFFADGSGFGDLPDADRKRLVAYGMARLSGYANTLFTLMTEWQEGWSAAEVDDTMDFLGRHNPWDRLATVHGVPGDFSFPAAPWADWLDLQAGLNVTHAFVHGLGLSNRELAAKPMVQEEFSLGHETTAERQKTWAAFTSGAAGIGTGAFLRPLAEFLAAVPFERLEPADHLVLSGGAYALAEPGQAYVFYLYDGGTVRVDLRDASGSFRARWFDPRTGVFDDTPDVSGGGERTFAAPAAGDWVLYLSRQAGGEGGGFFTLAPCRLIDTRQAADGPALASGQPRTLGLAGHCGVPAGAAALSLNVTVTGATDQGFVRFAPASSPLPLASTVNFGPGQTRANNAILPLAGGALATEATVSGGGSVHLILDVNGWFE